MKGVAFIPKEVDIKISGITLLSLEDVIKLPLRIRRTGYWWWLQTPGYAYNSISCVNYNGDILNIGHSIDDDNGSIRPALIVSNLTKLNLIPYSKIKLFNREWIVISKSMILADDPFYCHRFDKKSNKYKTSEVKKYLNKWLKERLKTNE